MLARYPVLPFVGTFLRPLSLGELYGQLCPPLQRSSPPGPWEQYSSFPSHLPHSSSPELRPEVQRKEHCSESPDPLWGFSQYIALDVLRPCKQNHIRSQTHLTFYIGDHNLYCRDRRIKAQTKKVARGRAGIPPRSSEDRDVCLCCGT